MRLSFGVTILSVLSLAAEARNARRRRLLFQKEAKALDNETETLLELLLLSSNSTTAAPSAALRQVPSGKGGKILPGDTTDVLDAVIIGSGWAGLGAAKVLDDSDLDFAILEAKDYVGGRSRSIALDESVIELGCQWIQGTSTANPIYRLAQKFNVPLKESGNFKDGLWSDEYQSSSPHRIGMPKYKHILKTVFRENWFPFQRNRQYNTNNDSSLRKTTDLYIQKARPTKDDERALEFVLNSIIGVEYGASLDDLSTWWWNQDEFIGGDDAVLPNGYSSLIESFANSLLNRIFLRSVVTKIDWTSEIANVTYVNDGVSKSVRARNVIVTVPLGVLQAERIMFEPALPSWKSTSIARLGNGLLNKLILKWNMTTTLPWPDGVEWVEKIATPQEHWTTFFSYLPTTSENILVGFTAGQEAKRVEQLADVEILAEALQSLQEMFGKTIPTPDAHEITRWGQDEYTLGSYSYYKVDSRPKDRKLLSAPLDGGRVHFAGEACHLLYPSTTHGALLSGLDTGNKVVKARTWQRKLEGGDAE